MPDSPPVFHKKMAIEKEEKHNVGLGRSGEKTARSYLRKRGWKILEKNFRTPFGEIDIIAQKGDIIAFTEVKARLSDAFGMPSESVTKQRKLRYIRGANYYFANREIDCVVRFDIIEVFRGEINHIEDAFRRE